MNELRQGAAPAWVTWRRAGLLLAMAWGAVPPDH